MWSSTQHTRPIQQKSNSSGNRFARPSLWFKRNNNNSNYLNCISKRRESIYRLFDKREKDLSYYSLNLWVSVCFLLNGLDVILSGHEYKNEKKREKCFTDIFFYHHRATLLIAPQKNKNNPSPFVCGCCVHRKIVFNDDDDDGPIYSSFFLFPFFDIHLILKSLTFFWLFCMRRFDTRTDDTCRALHIMRR